MAKRILVPVGGDERSETIVPVLAGLAQGTGSTVRLLKVFPVPEHVVDDETGRVIAYTDQETERLTAAGLAELARVEALLPNVPVERVVRFGDTVEEIVNEAEAFDADLLALATERAGRVRRAIVPGIADRVRDRAPIPTLVLAA
jgi:nucleotide-binding universal stress UspA family protein